MVATESRDIIKKCIESARKHIERLEALGNEIEDAWRRLMAWRVIELCLTKGRTTVARGEMAFVFSFHRSARQHWDNLLAEILTASAGFSNAVKELELFPPFGGDVILNNLYHLSFPLSEFAHHIYDADMDLWSVGEKIVLVKIGAIGVVYEGSRDDALRALVSRWNKKLAQFNLTIKRFKESVRAVRQLFENFIHQKAPIE